MDTTCSLVGTHRIEPGPLAPVVSWRRALALLTAVVLTLFVVHGSVPVLLAGRSAAPTFSSADQAGSAVEGAGINVDGVVEQVQHRVEREPSGRLAVNGSGYRAHFDDSGLSYRPDGSSTALGISLSSVGRGDVALPLTAGAWHGRANVAERAVSPTMTEQVTARSGEVEWDVVLDAPPTGRGSLTLGAHVTGTSGAPVREDHAWRLRLTSGANVRLGEVVVKDADGAVLFRRLPRLDGATIKLAVPESVLQRATYPLTIDPTVGAAKRVTGPGKRASADVAFDGTNYLVVWEDERGTTGSDIFAARIRASDGVNLDPGGIPVARDSKAETAPAVAWNGTVFLIVWELQFTSGDEDIWAQRVLPNGTRTGAQLIVADTTRSQRNPDVASNGSSFQVVWNDSTGSGQYQIWGQRIAGNGTPIDESDGHRVVQSDLNLTHPALAYNRSAAIYLVAYEVGGPVRSLDTARIIDGFGTNPVAHLDGSGGALAPAVASDGTNWLVAWMSISGNRYAIFTHTVNAAGQLSGAENKFGATIDNVYPDVAYNGQYVVTWTKRAFSINDILAARVDSGGGLPDGSAGFPIADSAADELGPAVTNGRSGGVGLVHTTGSDPSASIDFRSVSPK